MADDWPSAQLGDVVDLLTGFPFKSEHYVQDPSAPRLLRGDNVGQGALRWDGAKRWATDGTDDLGPYKLNEGDVILAMDRPWIEAGLKYASVRCSDLPALLVQRVARLRGTRRLDTGYLKFLIGSSGFTDHVLAVQTGTAVPHISGGQIKSFEFPLPPLPEQRAIAHILGTLDDKIELNRRVSETLEAMARALFKSWFVDFDPVRAKAEGRDPGLPKQIADLFPDSFLDSELGEVPIGWRVTAFGDIVEHLRDNETPLASPGTTFQHYSIPAYDEGQWPRDELGASIKSQKTRVPEGAVLLSKLNPEIERVWLVDVRPGERAVCSTEFLVLCPRAPFGRAFVFCLARSLEFRQDLEGLVTGTSKSHQRAQVGSILGLKTSCPPVHLLDRFSWIGDSMLMKAIGSRREMRTLASLRDTLLPKLISGELRVKDAERFVGRVA